MSRVLLAVPLAVLVLLGAYFAVGLTRDPRDLPSVLLDRSLPPINLPAVAASAPFTDATLRGRVGLLNVFASWCPSCRVEHPTLVALSAAKRVPIFGLAWKDKPAERDAWLADLGNPYLSIGDDASGRTAIDLGVTGAPETFVVDRHGRIRYKQIGPITEEVWSSTLEPMVRKLESER